MSKLLDITEKLTFGENPSLLIQGEKVEVNSDAPTVLKIMGLLGGEVTPDKVVDAYRLLFTEKEQKKLDKLKIPFSSFYILIQEAITLITGEGSGE